MLMPATPVIWCCLLLFQPHFFRCGVSDHATDGCADFLAVGRHPVAGLLAAIAGVGCGFTANLLIVTTDVLLSGISTEAAAAFNPQMHVSVIDNWYFMVSSVVVLTIVGGLITDKIIEPRLGQWQGNSDEKLQTLTESQRFGLRIAGVVSLLLLLRSR